MEINSFFFLITLLQELIGNKIDHLDASHPGENTFASYSVIGRCPNPNLKKSIVFLLYSKKNGINMVKN